MIFQINIVNDQIIHLIIKNHIMVNLLIKNLILINVILILDPNLMENQNHMLIIIIIIQIVNIKIRNLIDFVINFVIKLNNGPSQKNFLTLLKINIKHLIIDDLYVINHYQKN